MTSYFPKIAGMSTPSQQESTPVFSDKKVEKTLIEGIGTIVDEMLVSTNSISSTSNLPAQPVKRKVSQINQSRVEEEGSPTKKLKTISGRIDFGSAKVDIKDFSGVVTISSGNSSISINSNEELPLPNFPTPNFESSEKPTRPVPYFSEPERLSNGIVPHFPPPPKKLKPGLKPSFPTLAPSSALSSPVQGTPYNSKEETVRPLPFFPFPQELNSSKIPQTPSKKLRPGLSPGFPTSHSSPVPITPSKRKTHTPKGQEKLYSIYQRLSLTPLDNPPQVITLKKDIRATNGALLINKDLPLHFIGQGNAAFVYRQGNRVIKLPVLTLQDKLLQRNLTRTINGYEQLKKIEIAAAETFIVDDMIIAEYIEGSEPTFNDVARYFHNMFKSPFTHFIADFKPQNLKFANQKVICIDPTTLKDHTILSTLDFNSMVMELVMVFKEWQKKENSLDVRRYFNPEHYEGVGKDLYNETMERLFNPDPED